MTKQREAVEVQGVGERSDIIWPIKERAPRLKIRKTKAGAIHANEANAECGCAGVVGMSSEPRITPAMTED
jgi:hypothetical protein